MIHLLSTYLDQRSANTGEICNRSNCVFTFSTLNLKHLADLAPSQSEDFFFGTPEKTWQICHLREVKLNKSKLFYCQNICDFSKAGPQKKSISNRSAVRKRLLTPDLKHNLSDLSIGNIRPVYRPNCTLSRTENHVQNNYP